MRVGALWRYPVKSMAGEPLTSVRLDAHGVHADRLWAVLDVERNVVASGRRLPALLQCTARYVDEPGPDAAAGRVPPVLVTLPDGSEFDSSDPRMDAALSALADRDVRLVPLAGRGNRLPVREWFSVLAPRTLARDLGVRRDEPLPDLRRMRLRDVAALAVFATPPGTYVDLSPVHVITDASLRTVGAELDGAPADPRRFRPNVVLTGADGALPEHDWTGAELRLGTARLAVTMPTVRCVVPSRPQPGVPLDKRVTRVVARTADRFVGAYAEVPRAGEVSVGDDVSLVVARPPGLVRQVAASARGAALDTMVAAVGATRRFARSAGR